MPDQPNLDLSRSCLSRLSRPVHPANVALPRFHATSRMLCRRLTRRDSFTGRPSTRHHPFIRTGLRSAGGSDRVTPKVTARRPST